MFSSGYIIFYIPQSYEHAQQINNLIEQNIPNVTPINALGKRLCVAHNFEQYVLLFDSAKLPDEW